MAPVTVRFKSEEPLGCLWQRISSVTRSSLRRPRCRRRRCVFPLSLILKPFFAAAAVLNDYTSLRCGLRTGPEVERRRVGCEVVTNCNQLLLERPVICDRHFLSGATHMALLRHAED